MKRPGKLFLFGTFFVALAAFLAHAPSFVRPLLQTSGPELEATEKLRGWRCSTPVLAIAAAVAVASVGATSYRLVRRASQRRRPACCPRGALGSAPESAAFLRGQMITLDNGVQAYVSGDKQAGRAIIVASDIFGIHSGRHKVICDELAAAGFLVVMPDFFQGVFPDEGTSLPWWKLLLQSPGLVTSLGTSWQTVQDILVDSVFPFLSEQGCPTGKAGVLGFCWGAWVVIKACGNFPDRFACGVSAHPSVHNIVGLKGEKEQELLAKVKVPQLVLSTKDEPESWKSGGEAERILKATSTGHVFKDFSNMSHGFVPRGDVTDPTVAEAVNRALQYIKGYLGQHISRSVS